VFNDVYFSPTAIELLINNILYIIENKKIGIFNVCGKDRLSRYEFVTMLKSVDKKFTANLIPVTAGKSMPHLQHDLSMIPSEICAELDNNQLEDYLLKELKR